MAISLSGPSDEADEGAAGEEPHGGVAAEPRDRLAEEGPAQAGGGQGALLRYITVPSEKY